MLLLPAREARAQVTTGWVAGTIRDASGGVLPGVTVTLTGAALQRASLTATTAADGTYRLSLIPPGTYSVQVVLSGFTTQKRDDVEVALNRQTTLDFTLSIAKVSESVEVSAVAPVVEVTRSDTSTRVSQHTIESLPLNGRNFTDLITLVPGARPDPTQAQGTNISIFGERGSALSFLVDGAENNDPLNGGPQLRYPEDAIKEFEVITSGYQAEFGRAQGGVANIITRSGTNNFMGRGFWFYRNDAMDSSNVAGQAPPKLIRNQEGATLGGPIKRDKAYFFASFEKLNETRGVNIDQSKIPAFVIQGLATPGGKEDFGIGPKTAGYNGFGKFDYNLTTNNHFTFSVDRSTNDVTGQISSPVAGTIALPSAAATTSTPATAYIARETAIFGNNTFLETTGTFIRGESGNNLNQTTRSEPLLLLLRSGFLQTGAPFGGRVDRVSDRAELSQSLTHYVNGWGGDHQFKFGYDFNHLRVTGSSQVTNDVEYSAAFLSPNQAQIMAQQFATLGFAQPAARFFTLSANPNGSLNVDMTDNQIAGYAQDTWKPIPDVTLNLGLRYDWASLFGGAKKDVSPRLGFAWDVGGRHTTIVKADWGLFFDRNLLSAAATVPEKGGVFTKSAFDVALPRLGATYTDSLIDLVITSGFPTAGGGRTPAENPIYTPMANALRADPLALYKLLGISVPNPNVPPIVTAANIQQLSGLTPDQAIAKLKTAFPGTDWQFFNVPGGSIVGDQVLSFFPRGPLDLTRQVSQYSQDKTPYTNSFSIGVDQQIGSDFSLSVRYVRQRTRDLLTRRIINLYNVPPGNPNFGKTTDGGPQISAVTYDGLVNYDGVIVAFNKRLSHHYQFGLSYTGSRARDNLLTGNVGSTFANNNNPGLDYGPSNLSVPHVFVGNGTVTLPWDVNFGAIVYWRSGSVFSPRGIQDLDGDGLVDQRDTTVPRNSFRTKAYADIDLRGEKVVRLPGGQQISILAEAFNLFNRANVASVNGVEGPSFGQPVSFLPGREIQIGIRYLFGS
ncbi:MAG: TonB-dependent receptor [Acidobacteriota bacterium]|nr:TonB-dependent receptor [Acidobacteriota bacterium]